MNRMSHDKVTEHELTSASMTGTLPAATARWRAVCVCVCVCVCKRRGVCKGAYEDGSCTKLGELYLFDPPCPSGSPQLEPAPGEREIRLTQCSVGRRSQQTTVVVTQRTLPKVS